ncbi:MAG: leucine-rich repeat protein [Symbiobacteriaceae bacterium]|nr:leucine-rich repeat protein [Symbiobacteriaceae bacterium]
MRKGLAVTLQIVVCVSLALFSLSLADTSYKESGFTYVHLDDNTVMVTGIDISVYPYPTDIAIPESLGGKTVVRIDDWALSNVGLNSVILPDTVVTIGTGAFHHNFSLHNVILSQSLKAIGDRAFEGCWDLRYVSLPDHLESIGEYAFFTSRTGWNVFIPDSVEQIGRYAFFNFYTVVFATAGSVGETYCGTSVPFVTLAEGDDETFLSDTIVLQVGSNDIVKQGKRIYELEKPLQIVNGRTMVPLSFLIDFLSDEKVLFEDDDDMLAYFAQEHGVLVTIGESMIYVNEIEYNYGQEVIIEDGEILVPIRIFESFVSEIRWHHTTKTIALIPIMEESFPLLDE